MYRKSTSLFPEVPVQYDLFSEIPSEPAQAAPVDWIKALAAFVVCVEYTAARYQAVKSTYRSRLPSMP